MKLLVLLVGWLLCPGVAAATPHWIGSWGASPEPPGPQAHSFSDQTVRQLVRISAGGDRVRLRISNAYGRRPLRIGSASVARLAGDGADVPGSLVPVTFSGRPGAIVRPGGTRLSDAVVMGAPALSRLSVSLYVRGQTGPCTCHAIAVEEAYVSPPGDFTRRPFTPVETLTSRAFLTGVEVRPARSGKVIVVLGDSLTDGFQSGLGADRRWPDRLAARLARERPDQAWGVVNAGISGNRLLGSGYGEAAPLRFGRDVLAVPGVAYVVVSLGLNDIRHSRIAGLPPPGVEDLVAADRRMIAQAHARGVRVIGATLTPFEGESAYSPAGEAVRQAVNRWIRDGGEFDGVADFDAAWRDPGHPSRIRADLQAGDWLHGNDAGYAALGDAIGLSLFRSGRVSGRRD